MGIRVFISGNSGNQKISNEQQTICSVLKTRNIEFEKIDIAAPGMEPQRNFMRNNGKKRDGQRYPLPPQIFNGEQYRGDFFDFDIANEDDVLEEFLGLPRKYQKQEMVKTGATARPVDKLNPGKLNVESKVQNKNEIVLTEIKCEDLTLEETFEILEEFPNSSEPANDDETLPSNAVQMNSSLETSFCLLQPNISEQVVSYCDDADDDDDDAKDPVRQIAESPDIAINIESFKEEVINEALKVEAEKVIEKTDGLTNHVSEDFVISNFEAVKGETIENIDTDLCKVASVVEDIPDITKEDDDDDEDSSDESDFTESEDEFMPDGERVRKTSRGFKQISNCKRFWKASMLMG